MRGLAESVSEEGAAATGLADEYFPVALVVPVVARKKAGRASITKARTCRLFLYL